jgi:hypothetical protein
VVGTPEGKRQLGRTLGRWKNISGWIVDKWGGVMGQIPLVLDRDPWLLL